MSRGLVMRFAESSEREVQKAWAAVESAGMPSLRTHTHQAHVPHLSLAVAEVLDNDRAANAVAKLQPPKTIQLESVGYFPEGVLFLNVVPTQGLLRLQSDIFEQLSLSGAMTRSWLATRPDSWSPHVTVAYGVAAVDLGAAVQALTPVLPMTLGVDGLWIEDGATGEAWPVPPFGLLR